MIEVEIPNDVKEFEPKVLGPFTLRQIICVIGIVVTSLAGYFIINTITDNGLRIIIPMILDIPWALIGYYKPYGMKFEQYFISQLNTTIIPPKHRYYKTENLYELFENQMIAEETAQAQNQNKTNTKKSKTNKSKKGGSV